MHARACAHRAAARGVAPPALLCSPCSQPLLPRLPAPRKPSLEGRFSGRLNSKQDEVKLADECRRLSPLLGGCGKRGDKSLMTLAKVVRGIVSGHIREHLQRRELTLQFLVRRLAQVDSSFDPRSIELVDPRLLCGDAGPSSSGPREEPEASEPLGPASSPLAAALLSVPLRDLPIPTSPALAAAPCGPTRKHSRCGSSDSEPRAKNNTPLAAKVLKVERRAGMPVAPDCGFAVEVRQGSGFPLSQQPAMYSQPLAVQEGSWVSEQLQQQRRE